MPRWTSSPTAFRTCRSSTPASTRPSSAWRAARCSSPSGCSGPGKGIEYAIEALPEIVGRHPNVVYLVLGATHPHLVAREGESYRLGLERLAEDLGVKEHVIFYNRFVSLDDLKEFIGATDIYLTPYLNEAQITSGTLAYVFGAGKAVVSTTVLACPGTARRRPRHPRALPGSARHRRGGLRLPGRPGPPEGDPRRGLPAWARDDLARRGAALPRILPARPDRAEGHTPRRPSPDGRSPAGPTNCHRSGSTTSSA